MIPSVLEGAPFGEFLHRVRSSSDTADWSIGPVSINDVSSGVNYQEWVATFSGSTVNITPTTGTPTSLVLPVSPYRISLAFDQNAQVCLAYETDSQAYMYWYDPTEGYTHRVLPVGARSVCVVLDDPRDDFLFDSDIHLSYVRDGSLYACAQRERFNIEHLIASPASELVSTGPSRAYRVQWKYF